MDAVKFGLIGAGDAGNFHTLAFKGKSGAKVQFVAVCDINEKAAQKFAKRLKIAAFTDVDAFLQHEMDAVLVAVPHFLHAEMVKRVVEAGKHVICEKPMAPTLEECDEMIAATKKAGVKFMIAENHRFLPAHQKMKELVDNGFLGDVYLGRTYEGAFVPQKTFLDASNWQFTYEQGGGGVLADQGVHKFAFLQYLLGDVDRGEAWLSKVINSPDNKGEDNAMMNLHFQNGAIVNVIVSSTTVHPLNNDTELHGTRGHLLENHSWDTKPLKIFSNHPDAEKKGEYYEIEVEHSAYPQYYLIAAFHEDTHFAECILNDTDPAFTPEQARQAVAVVLLGYLSAKKGRAVTMDELQTIADNEGTKSVLEDLQSVTQKNYERMKW